MRGIQTCILHARLFVDYFSSINNSNSVLLDPTLASMQKTLSVLPTFIFSGNVQNFSA